MLSNHTLLVGLKNTVTMQLYDDQVVCETRVTIFNFLSNKKSPRGIRPCHCSPFPWGVSIKGLSTNFKSKIDHYSRAAVKWPPSARGQVAA